MEVRNIPKGFEASKTKFKAFERDLKHPNVNSTLSKGLKHSNANSNHLKGIQSIQIQILTIRKGFKAFECKFEPFESDSKHSNAKSNHSNQIRHI